MVYVKMVNPKIKVIFIAYIHPVCVNFEKHYSFIIHTRGTNY